MFNVPYRRNPLFTGRSEALRTIHRKLVSEASSIMTSSYVLYGLGGVGKTQIAIEYSYQHRDDFDLIHWLRADDYETLLRNYFQLYQDDSFRALTGLNLGDETNLEIICAQVKLWFENCQDIKWLLVIDNADELERDNITKLAEEQQKEILASIIPRGRTGFVLITSRNRAANGQLASDGDELRSMDEDDAKIFLDKCSKSDYGESDDAFALLRDLDGFPLAIEQAGGVIRENGITIAEYRRLYNANMSEALREGLNSTHKQEYYRETVSTTWNVSFQAIHQRDRLASIILRIAAFLDGKQIQKDLFYDAKLNIDGYDVQLLEWKVTKAFGTLMSYSLIHPVKGEESIEMHLLVQSVIRQDSGIDR